MVFQELGANSPTEVSFEKVRPDRLELDKIVLRDILGLSEKEHLEVYQAVIDLVKSRDDAPKFEMDEFANFDEEEEDTEEEFDEELEEEYA